MRGCSFSFPIWSLYIPEIPNFLLNPVVSILSLGLEFEYSRNPKLSAADLLNPVVSILSLGLEFEYSRNPKRPAADLLNGVVSLFSFDFSNCRTKSLNDTPIRKPEITRTYVKYVDNTFFMLIIWCECEHLYWIIIWQQYPPTVAECPCYVQCARGVQGPLVFVTKKQHRRKCRPFNLFAQPCPSASRRQGAAPAAATCTWARACCACGRRPEAGRVANSCVSLYI